MRKCPPVTLHKYPSVALLLCLPVSLWTRLLKIHEWMCRTFRLGMYGIFNKACVEQSHIACTEYLNNAVLTLVEETISQRLFHSTSILFSEDGRKTDFSPLPEFRLSNFRLTSKKPFFKTEDFADSESYFNWLILITRVYLYGLVERGKWEMFGNEKMLFLWQQLAQACVILFLLNQWPNGTDSYMDKVYFDQLVRKPV